MIRKDPSEHDLPSPVEYIECDHCGDFFHPDVDHNCARQIAVDIMAYSKAHENDALAAREPTGDMKWVNWEIPYYCNTVDEIEAEVIENGYKSTAHAIREMSKGFKMYFEYEEDIKGSIF